MHHKSGIINDISGQEINFNGSGGNMGKFNKNWVF